ncbi:MAG: carbohydrate-binding domain-containing protein [Bifidobacteriaceae bacterium]|nr:carbohydrate-binding domain-containing protein [Bifidobacteriaceae bacterium]
MKALPGLAALALAASTCAGCAASPNQTASGAPPKANAAALDVPQSVAEVLAESLETHWQASDAAPGTLIDLDLGLGSATIEEPGAYRLSGTLEAGQVKVEVEERGLVQLVLDDAHVTSTGSSALYVESADEVAVILAEGSSNSLTDASTYDSPDEEPDAALFSKANLTIAGSGALTVTGRAGDAIASKDGLVVAGGSLRVEAADDGLRGRDYLRLLGGSLSVNAKGDGLKSTNGSDPGAGYILFEGADVAVKAGTDCADAASDVLVAAGTATLSCGDDGLHAEARLVMDGGSVRIADSFEGMEAAVLVIAGGQTDIVSSDDAVNAAAGDDAGQSGDDVGRPGDPARGPGARGAQAGVALVVAGGRLTVKSGGDGLDSNGTGLISGGDIAVYTAARGAEGPFDIADGGPVITGGTVWAFGAGDGAGAISAPDADSTQGWAAASFAAGLAAGSELTVTDASGQPVGGATLTESVSALVFSSAGVVNGQSYRVGPNGSQIEVAAGVPIANGPGRDRRR